MAAFVIVNAAPPARSRQSASVFRSPVIAGKDLLLQGKTVAHRRDACDIALIVLEAGDLVSDGAVHQQLEAERVVNELYEVAAQPFVLARPAADRADLRGIVAVTVRARISEGLLEYPPLDRRHRHARDVRDGRSDIRRRRCCR